MTKVILTDIDGVILNWEKAFVSWMADRGYSRSTKAYYDIHGMYDISFEEADRLIREFNISDSIAHLEPIRKSTEVIPMLLSEGFEFIGITSMNPKSRDNRKKNIKNVFGSDPFSTIIYANPKTPHLEDMSEKFGNVVWIEDHPDNADLGVKSNLDSLLMDHDYNRAYDGQAKRITDWNCVVNHLVEKGILQ